jgi:hypothetical protein
MAQGILIPTAQAVPSTSRDDVVSQLERLAALWNQGFLSEDEFLQQKAKILAQ